MELAGRAVPALAELEAPLTGRRCLIYRVALGLLQRLLEGGGPSREIVGLGFLLRSDDGPRLLVEPAGVTSLRLPTRLRARLSFGRDAARDARLTSLYQRLDRGAPPASVACCEQRLDEGDWVVVSGWIEEQPHAAGEPRGYREPPQLPVLRAARLTARRV